MYTKPSETKVGKVSVKFMLNIPVEKEAVKFAGKVLDGTFYASAVCGIPKKHTIPIGEHHLRAPAARPHGRRGGRRRRQDRALRRRVEVDARRVRLWLAPRSWPSSTRSTTSSGTSTGAPP
jgi:hypothetical protein